MFLIFFDTYYLTFIALTTLKLYCCAYSSTLNLWFPNIFFYNFIFFFYYNFYFFYNLSFIVKNYLKFNNFVELYLTFFFVSYEIN